MNNDDAIRINTRGSNWNKVSIALIEAGNDVIDEEDIRQWCYSRADQANAKSQECKKILELLYTEKLP